ncbi:MAG: hypothetical protein F9K23_13025 [Bacteroidetes bacterium]|nr:MAG: hypothetical protein F9K23_13025 [Bacteroidota bacterium]
MSNILKQYQVNFYKKIVSGINFSFCESKLKPTLCQFLSDYILGDDIQEFIINQIDSVKTNTITIAKIYIQISSDTGIIAYIDINNTKFVYTDKGGSWSFPDEQLPTDDFEKIVLEWMSFINKI